MTIEILTFVVAILFLSIMYLYWRIQGLQKMMTLFVIQFTLHNNMINAIIKTLSDKKLISIADLTEIKEEQAKEEPLV